MKHSTIFLALALSFSGVSAESIVSAPVSPHDLETAWTQVVEDTCVRDDGINIIMRNYDRNTEENGSVISRRMYIMTKDGHVIHQAESIIDRRMNKRTMNAVTKRIDGTWVLHDYIADRDGADGTVEEIIGMTQSQFVSCVLEQRQ